MFWFWGWFIGFYHIHVNAIKHQYSWGYYTIIEWIWWNITIWFHSKPNHPLPQSLSPIGVSEIEDRNPRNGILIWLVNGMVYGIGFATLDQSFVFEWPLGWWTTEPIERPRVVSSCARYFKVAPQYCFSKLHHWQLAKLYIQEEKPFPGIQQFEHQNQNHPCIKFPSNFHSSPLLMVESHMWLSNVPGPSPCPTSQMRHMSPALTWKTSHRPLGPACER